MVRHTRGRSEERRVEGTDTVSLCIGVMTRVVSVLKVSIVVGAEGVLLAALVAPKQFTTRITRGNGVQIASGLSASR